MKIILLFIKPVIWLVLICYGLFLPAKSLPVKPFMSIPHFDKMVHFGLFFMLCLLLFRPFKRLNMKHFIFAPATAIFLGAVLEALQRTIATSRSSNFADFLANASGIAISVVFFNFFVSGKKWEKLF